MRAARTIFGLFVSFAVVLSSGNAVSSYASPSATPLDNVIAAAQDVQARGDIIPGFAGVRIRTDTLSVVVYMTQTDGNSESIAIGSNSPALFTFRPAQRTWSQLGQLRDRITHDLATLRGQGVDPTAWGPDVDLNTVTASVGTNASAAQQVFDASYGLVRRCLCCSW